MKFMKPKEGLRPDNRFVTGVLNKYSIQEGADFGLLLVFLEKEKEQEEQEASTSQPDLLFHICNYYNQNLDITLVKPILLKQIQQSLEGYIRIREQGKDPGRQLHQEFFVQKSVSSVNVQKKNKKKASEAKLLTFKEVYLKNVELQVENALDHLQTKSKPVTEVTQGRSFVLGLGQWVLNSAKINEQINKKEARFYEAAQQRNNMLQLVIPYESKARNKAGQLQERTDFLWKKSIREFYEKRVKRNLSHYLTEELGKKEAGELSIFMEIGTRLLGTKEFRGEHTTWFQNETVVFQPIVNEQLTKRISQELVLKNDIEQQSNTEYTTLKSEAIIRTTETSAVKAYEFEPVVKENKQTIQKLEKKVYEYFQAFKEKETIIPMVQGIFGQTNTRYLRQMRDLVFESRSVFEKIRRQESEFYSSQYQMLSSLQLITPQSVKVQDADSMENQQIGFLWKQQVQKQYEHQVREKITAILPKEFLKEEQFTLQQIIKSYSRELLVKTITGDEKTWFSQENENTAGLQISREGSSVVFNQSKDYGQIIREFSNKILEIQQEKEVQNRIEQQGATSFQNSMTYLNQLIQSPKELEHFRERLKEMGTTKEYATYLLKGVQNNTNLVEEIVKQYLTPQSLEQLKDSYQERETNYQLIYQQALENTISTQFILQEILQKPEFHTRLLNQIKENMILQNTHQTVEHQQAIGQLPDARGFLELLIKENTTVAWEKLEQLFQEKRVEKQIQHTKEKEKKTVPGQAVLQLKKEVTNPESESFYQQVWQEFINQTTKKQNSRRTSQYLQKKFNTYEGSLETFLTKYYSEGKDQMSLLPLILKGTIEKRYGKQVERTLQLEKEKDNQENTIERQLINTIVDIQHRETKSQTTLRETVSTQLKELVEKQIQAKQYAIENRILIETQKRTPGINVLNQALLERHSYLQLTNQVELLNNTSVSRYTALKKVLNQQSESSYQKTQNVLNQSNAIVTQQRKEVYQNAKNVLNQSNANLTQQRKEVYKNSKNVLNQSNAIVTQQREELHQKIQQVETLQKYEKSEHSHFTQSLYPLKKIVQIVENNLRQQANPSENSSSENLVFKVVSSSMVQGILQKITRSPESIYQDKQILGKQREIRNPLMSHKVLQEHVMAQYSETGKRLSSGEVPAQMKKTGLAEETEAVLPTVLPSSLIYKEEKKEEKREEAIAKGNQKTLQIEKVLLKTQKKLEETEKSLKVLGQEMKKQELLIETLEKNKSKNMIYQSTQTIDSKQVKLITSQVMGELEQKLRLAKLRKGFD